jgi:GNAT superfamily N-acetyltransferase
MFWRLEPSIYDENFGRKGRPTGTGNKRLMERVVARGEPPGLIAYREGRPVGWVAVSPRSELVRLRHSPGLRTDDDRPGWAISCFYVHRSEWHTGVGQALLEAAVAYAREAGASEIEAYPVKVGNIDPYTGYESMFERAGFSPTRLGRGLGRALWWRSLRPRPTPPR